MTVRKIFSYLPVLLAIIFFLPEICLCSPSEITSILQLNDPRYRVGSDSDGPVLERARENLPNAQILKYNDFLSEYLALQSGKIDALTANESEFISAIKNGLEHVRILPGYLGSPVPTAAGISEVSEIPGLREKFNAFIAGLKADGTLSAMYKRWVDDNNHNMPAIDVPEKSDIHLTVGTTGVVMPFSFFINSTVTGFDVELGRRFAAYIGATVEFKMYGFGSILQALKSGAIDIALSNLYVTQETEESVIFSDIVFPINCIVAVYDDRKTPVIPERETGNFEAFRGKRIGVFTGSVQNDMVKNSIPGADILYFDSLANIIGSLVSGKIDAAAVDKTIAAEAERTNRDLTHMNEALGNSYAAFLFPKSPKNNPLADEINEYIRRIKSDGTLEQIRAIWTGTDESKKIIPDYSKFPDTNGTIRIAADNATPVFSYMKDGKLTGHDIDVIVRFCREKGYRPNFSMINFTGVIPAVNSGKCDMGIGGITMTPERAESVRFSEPVCTLKSVLLLKSPGQTQPSAKAGTSRRPKYSTLAELDGKPIGMQPAVYEWSSFIRELMPHSQVIFYNTFTDILTALKNHRIEGFPADEPVFNLLAAEDENIAKIDGEIDKSYDLAYGFPKNDKGRKLRDEMSEYIRKIKASGELDAIIAKWEGADESAKTLPDYKNFPAPNGVLTMATEGEYPPFNYYRGNEIAGYEIDIAARFCEAYGYGLRVSSMTCDAIIAAVISGKCDFAADALTPSDEHLQQIYFSEPYAKSRSVMVCLKADDSPAPAPAVIGRTVPKYKHLTDLDGKPIGMQPGIIDWEEWAAKTLPLSKVQYYSTYPDLVSALKTHKIEGFLVDSPVLALMAAEDNTLAYIDEPVGKPFGYSFFYAQTEAGKKLCDEMSEYIRKIKASGELDAILSKWQGADESAKIPPDFKSLPAKNGTLTYAAEGSYPPFNYYKGTKLAGIDIDIAVEFCRAYGYGLDVQTMLFDATIPAINSGKVDFAGDFTPSEEHEEAVYFSETYCNARSVMACLKDDSPQNVSESYPSLAGKIIGVQTGTTCAELVPEKIPSAKLAYYDSLTDELTALKAGKVSAICCSLPAAIFAENEDSRLARINPPLRETYLYPIFSQTDKGRKLCAEYSAFLKTLWDNGTIDALNEKWLGHDDSKKITDDYSQLPATNGRIIMAVDTSLVPFAYVKDNRIVGYDIDLAVRFCKEKGYALEVQNMPLTGAIASVKTGKSDFTQSLNKTPERAENTLFTETPAVKSGNVLLTFKADEYERAESSAMYTDKSQLAGKRIGAMLGTINPEIARENVPSANIVEFSSMAATLFALKSGNVDAICVPVPVARFMMHDNYDIDYCGEQLTNYNIGPIFPKTEKGEKLRGQYTDFIKPLWDNGTLHWLDGKWFSRNDSEQAADDYLSLPNPNGTLRMAADLSVMPFAFMRDGKIMGYDVDLAGRFCRAYGYGLEIVPMPFGEIIPALESGECDFAASSIAYTEERAQSVLFSYPNGRTGNVFLVMKSPRKNLPAVYTDLSQLNGKRIGVAVGSMNGQLAKEKIPGAEIVYFNSNSDILPALIAGKIDAISCGHSTALFMIREGHNVTYLPQQLGKTHRKAAFANTERGRKLCREYSDFVKTLWDNGTIAALVYKWIDGEDDSQRVLDDYSNLPHPNGILTMAVDPSVTPYVYTKGKRILGYEIDIAVRFCKAKGYGLKVEAMSHNGVLGSLETGKCDFSYGIEYTDERDKSLLLSETPNTESSNVIVVMKPSAVIPSVNMKLSDFAGKKIGVVTGTNNAIIVKEKIPSAILAYYESPADILMALKQGKIDALSCGLATSVFVINENDGLARVSEPLQKNYHSAAFVSSDKGRDLRSEYGEFLRELRDSGTIKRLYDKWIMNNDEYTKGEDYSHLPSEKGTLKMAADPAMIPFVYVRNNKIIGYDIDIAVMFCRAKGYGLEVVPMSHSGVLGAVASGKCDFSYAMEYTAERAKSVLFSEVPNVEADNVLVVLKPSAKTPPPPVQAVHTENNAPDEPSFWDDVASSFRKTFIREDRWKLFAEGIMNTMIITVSSIFCGMLLGFAAFMFCRTGSITANIITKFSVWLIKGTPIVVLLMILYYIIFGSVNISGIVVAIIAFTLTFGTSVYRMLTFGTGAVDRGQTEAAYALGFTDMQTFFTVILPQAALHFMPSFKEEVTMLIKSTSVVGYIAVQDLTKMGDIVRSRTYEAFFPLIAVAVIYFVLAGMLNIIVNIIHVRITPSKRKPGDILRGIDTLKEGENHD